jgi:hypothetical protein
MHHPIVGFFRLFSNRITCKIYNNRKLARDISPQGKFK